MQRTVQNCRCLGCGSLELVEDHEMVSLSAPFAASLYAAKILREAKRKFVTIGKDPTGVAAATLHIACQLRNGKITQKEIAAAASILEVTLRSREKELREKLNLNKTARVKSQL